MSDWMALNQQIQIICICCQTVDSVCMSGWLFFSLFWFKIVGLPQVSTHTVQLSLTVKSKRLQMLSFVPDNSLKRCCHTNCTCIYTQFIVNMAALKKCLSEEIRGYSICFLCWLTDISALIWTRSEVSFSDTRTFSHTRTYAHRELRW